MDSDDTAKDDSSKDDSSKDDSSKDDTAKGDTESQSYLRRLTRKQAQSLGVEAEVALAKEWEDYDKPRFI